MFCAPVYGVYQRRRDRRLGDSRDVTSARMSSAPAYIVRGGAARRRGGGRNDEQARLVCSIGHRCAPALTRGKGVKTTTATAPCARRERAWLCDHPAPSAHLEESR